MAFALRSVAPSEPLVLHPSFNQNVKFKSSSELYNFIRDGYNSMDGKPNLGPISITQGQVKENGKTEDVYLVGLSGTEFVENQATGIKEDLQSAHGLSNDFLNAIRTSMEKTVPRGAKVVIAGHSLGGMVAQQAAADPWIRRRYDISDTVTFGSPEIADAQKNREGDLHRLTDTADAVPYSTLVPNMFSLPSMHGVKNSETIVRKSEYSGLTDPHCKSYGDSRVWHDVDALGHKNGNAVMELDLSTRQFFHAPDL
jgi:hypothetical protein